MFRKVQFRRIAFKTSLSSSLCYHQLTKYHSFIPRPSSTQHPSSLLPRATEYYRPYLSYEVEHLIITSLSLACFLRATRREYKSFPTFASSELVHLFYSVVQYSSVFFVLSATTQHQPIFNFQQVCLYMPITKKRSKLI